VSTSNLANITSAKDICFHGNSIESHLLFSVKGALKITKWCQCRVISASSKSESPDLEPDNDRRIIFMDE